MGKDKQWQQSQKSIQETMVQSKILPFLESVQKSLSLRSKSWWSFQFLCLSGMLNFDFEHGYRLYQQWKPLHLRLQLQRLLLEDYLQFLQQISQRSKQLQGSKQTHRPRAYQ